MGIMGRKMGPVCLVAISFFLPAVWATLGPVIALCDKLV